MRPCPRKTRVPLPGPAAPASSYPSGRCAGAARCSQLSSGLYRRLPESRGGETAGAVISARTVGGDFETLPHSLFMRPRQWSGPGVSSLHRPLASHRALLLRILECFSRRVSLVYLFLSLRRAAEQMKVAGNLIALGFFNNLRRICRLDLGPPKTLPGFFSLFWLFIVATLPQLTVACIFFF